MIVTQIMDKIQDRFFFPGPWGGGYLGVCYTNPRAPVLLLLMLFNTTVCGREVNRPNELYTVRGTYQQRRHVRTGCGWDKQIGSILRRRNDSV